MHTTARGGWPTETDSDGALETLGATKAAEAHDEAIGGSIVPVLVGRTKSAELSGASGPEEEANCRFSTPRVAVSNTASISSSVTDVYWEPSTLTLAAVSVSGQYSFQACRFQASVENRPLSEAPELSCHCCQPGHSSCCFPVPPTALVPGFVLERFFLPQHSPSSDACFSAAQGNHLQLLRD